MVWPSSMASIRAGALTESESESNIDPKHADVG